MLAGQFNGLPRNGITRANLVRVADRTVFSLDGRLSIGQLRAGHHRGQNLVLDYLTAGIFDLLLDCFDQGLTHWIRLLFLLFLHFVSLVGLKRLVADVADLVALALCGGLWSTFQIGLSDLTVDVGQITRRAELRSVRQASKELVHISARVVLLVDEVYGGLDTLEVRAEQGIGSDDRVDIQSAGQRVLHRQIL